MKDNLYTEMQRQTLPEEATQLLSENKKSTLFSGCAQNNDSSPFNSKFTVLKFGSGKKSSPQYGQYSFGSEAYAARGLFSNSSNFSFSS